LLQKQTILLTTLKESKLTPTVGIRNFPIEAVLAIAFQEALSIAVWRLPQHKNYHLIIGLETKKLSQPNLEELKKGFIVSPFLPSKVQHIQYIPADIHFQFSEENSFQLQLNQESVIVGNTPQKEVFLQKMQQPKIDKPHYYHSAFKEKLTDKETFINKVKKAVEAMEANQFKKVVLSRCHQEPIKTDFSLIDSFLKLSAKYPHAFISLVSTPETGTWLGASPETLVEVDKNQHFKTMALAGTQKRKKFEDLREMTWKQKEIEEQALVSRYIINCFKKIRLREFEEIGPRTVAAAALAHLRTDFIVNLKETNFPELGSVMLQLLHPTSAVCGMPKEAATAFIQENEGYDRGLYSGYLGPIQIEESTNLFVNLRCAQLTGNQVIYYAGAGITVDSVAEKEWEETALKMGTVAACL